MGIFERLERKVEGAVSGAFARAFKGDVQPVEITARLQRELDAEAKLMSRDKRLVPNEFAVRLSQHDHDKLAPYAKTLTAELAGELRKHAREMGYVFNGPIKIDFELDTRLPTGRFTVTSKAVAGIAERGGPAGDTTINRAEAGAGGQRHSPSAAATGPGDRPGQRRGPADQRPRYLADARPDPGELERSGTADRHRRPRLDQRHRRQRAEGAPGRPVRGVTDRDRVDPDARPRSRRRGSRPCLRSPSPIIKVLFLALLWLFILSAVSVIRSDLFGRTVPAPGQPAAQELESPPPPPKKAKRQRGEPRIFSITQGNQAGQSAELAAGVIMIGRGADCQLILDDDYVSTRHARVVGGEQGRLRRGPRLDQRHLRQRSADHRADHDHAVGHRADRQDDLEAGAVSR